MQELRRDDKGHLRVLLRAPLRDLWGFLEGILEGIYRGSFKGGYRVPGWIPFASLP